MVLSSGKKCFFIVLSFLGIIFFLSVGSLIHSYIEYNKQYEGWKRVMLFDGGSICVPEDWILTEKDRVIYFANQSVENSNEMEDKIYFQAAYGEKSAQIAESLCDIGRINSPENVEKRGGGYSQNYGGAAHSYFSDYLYQKGENVIRIKCITFYASRPETIVMYSVGDIVDRDTGIKIAKSYRSVKPHSGKLSDF